MTTNKQTRNTKEKKTRKSFTNQFWYNTCKIYTKNKYLNPKTFLLSNDCPGELSFSESTVRQIRKKLVLYKTGALKEEIPGFQTDYRKKNGIFVDVEARVESYLISRDNLFRKDKVGMTREILRTKAVEIAKKLGYSDFPASNSWLIRVLKKEVGVVLTSMVRLIPWIPMNS